MKRSIWVTLLTSLTICLLFSGCKETRQMSEMHDDTKEMNQTTKEMDKKTKDISDSTKRVEKNSEGLGETSNQMNSKMTILVDETKIMYFDMRKGDTLKARRDAKTAILQTKDPTVRVKEAAVYLGAFEYQLWSGVGQDTAEKREVLAALAAREFFFELNEFSDKTLINLGPLSEDPYQATFNALSSALHYSDTNQLEMLKKHSELKEINMLSMITEALNAELEMKKDPSKKMTDYPLYIKEILIYQKLAEELLTARYDNLLTCVLFKVANLRKTPLIYAQIAKMLVLSWQINPLNLNIALVNEAVEYLKEAGKTKETLEKLGLELKKDWRLHRILQNGSFTSTETSNLTKGLDPRSELLHLWNQILK